ncbi:hypothetical protein OROMI_022636 [Orobanche minor]
MALKFLNKKGWHTGSLRNVENVWKAEQKHEAEQRKIEELRKQIHEERERAEFRQLQEQAGLIPKQERLDFLYESGLAVGKGSSSFKELESLPKTEPDAAAAASSSASGKQPAVPGALFEEKSQSANDAWRKLHSDPLLLIRQREQEALARVKNNPIQMAMIRKSVQAEKDKDVKKQKKKHHREESTHRKCSSSENESDYEDAEKQRGSSHKSSKSYKPSSKKMNHTYSDAETSEDDARRKKYHEEKIDYHNTSKQNSHYNSRHKEYSSERHEKQSRFVSSSGKPPRDEPSNRHKKPRKLSDEERAARLREMQMDAEIHEQQRWKRLKKAADSDAKEAIHDRASLGRNFLHAAQKSVYGADKGGSKTIEESVRRRMHYSQGRSATDSNAFRRS